MRGAGAQQPPTPWAPGTQARRPRILVGAIVLVGVALCGVGLETGLAAAGLGVAPRGQESALRYQHVFLPVLEPARLAATHESVLATVDPRLVRRVLASPKPPGTLRVFVFGGSATAGLGTSPNAAFPALLERLLSQARPELAVEVLNLGMVALPSSGVRALVEDVCAHGDPDLLVVYSGNNEFLELHSERFFAATASRVARLRHAFSNTHVARWLRGLRGSATPRPRITSRDIASADARVDHRAMLREVHISDADRRETEERYAENLRAMAAAAREAGAPLVLMTVASNWRWWALADLPDLPGEPGETGEREELYRRARAAEAAGDFGAARDLYRASFNADPHLRRATDALAARVRDVAALEGGVELFDTIAYLETRVPHGIVGFETFYDYVHFTPPGAWTVARGLAERLAELGLAHALPPSVAEETARAWEATCTRDADGLAIDSWIGFGADPERLASRDLWKYDRLWDELDARVAADARDARALAWRGNLQFFLPGSEAAAAADYEAALALAEGSALEEPVRANLARLERERLAP